MFHRLRLAVGIFSALALFAVVTGSAQANLTIGATSISSDGNYTVNGVTGSVYAFGAATTTGTITIGGTAQTGNIVLGSSSGVSSVLIGNGAGASTVSIAATGTAGNTVHIADSAGANVVTIGSTTGAASLALQAGTGNFALTGAVATTYTIGTAAGTGTITIGQSTAGQTINIGATNSVQTIHIGDHASPANVITIGGAASSVTLGGSVSASGRFLKSVNTGLTALAGGAQAGTALTKDINFVTTVATTADSVQLPVAVVGMDITVINRGANSLNVFGQTGDGINAGGANAAYAVAANVAVHCMAIGTSGAAVWECQKTSR